MTTEVFSASKRDRGVPYMIAMGVMTAGYQSVDYLTGSMLPLTLRHFTDNALMIACMISFNRLFGFIVQPYVMWKSDQVKSKMGRRRPFLLVGIPCTALFLGLLGASPLFIQGEARHMVSTFVFLFAINILLQAFQDVNTGIDSPLYADTFEQSKLGRVSSVRQFLVYTMVLFMSWFAMKWADKNEFFPYLVSIVLLSASFLIVAFIIRENPVVQAAPTEKYSPLKYFNLLRTSKDYRKLAIIGAIGLMYPASFEIFLSLFATETLGLTKASLGKVLGVGSFIVLAVSFPVGYIVDRFGPKPMIAMGFFLWIGTSTCMVFYVHDFGSLLVICTLNVAASQMYWLAIMPMAVQFAPENERGKIFGLIQFVRALAAFFISLVIGQVVNHFHNYRAGYVVCILLAAVGVMVAFTIRHVSNTVKVDPVDLD